MAKPVKKERLHQSTLERSPKHVQAIGMIAIEITNLEISLGELLGALLHVNSHVGRIVYLTPQAVAARLSIIENVAIESLVDGSRGLDTISSIVKRARAVMGRRNELIHIAWGVQGEDMSEVITIPPLEFHKTSSKPVPLKELRDLIERIRDLHDEVIRESMHIYREWPPYTWKETHREPPLPDQPQE